MEQDGRGHLSSSATKPRRLGWFRLLLVAAAVVGVVVLFRRVDWPSTRAYLAELGGWAPAVLVPYFFMLASDTLGWRSTFEARPPLAPLLRIRVATEAVIGSLPAGMAVGESLRVILLERMLGIPVPAAAANVVVSKLAMALAQGIFIVAGVVLALTPLEPRSPVSAPGSPAQALGIAAALAFLAVVGGVLALLSRGRILSRLLDLAHVASGTQGRARLARLREPLAQLDHGLSALVRLPPRQVAVALGWFLAGWVCLGCENWLILALLRAPVSLSTAMSIEGAVSIVRIGFFFLPGGLGAQEAGYYGLLEAYGLPHPGALAAAFVVVKRAKEVAWIAVGYGLLLSLPVSARGVLSGAGGAAGAASATAGEEISS